VLGASSERWKGTDRDHILPFLAVRWKRRAIARAIARRVRALLIKPQMHPINKGIRKLNNLSATQFDFLLQKTHKQKK
jgi:hypothetical protein